MNTFSNPGLSAVAPASAARDIVRIVIVAALAGTGFAILLALAVLSLTVIAPPAIASGGAAMISSEPAQGARATADQPLDRASAEFIGEAAAAQPAPASVPLTRIEAATDDSVLGMPNLAVLALVLAVLAGVAAFLVRARGKQ